MLETFNAVVDLVARVLATGIACVVLYRFLVREETDYPRLGFYLGIALYCYLISL